MGWLETKAFLSKVVPWPGDDPGYVNLHYSIKNEEEGKKDFVTGRPFRDIEELLGFAGWARDADNIKEQWFCTSLQSESSTSKAGKPKAVRLHHNARSLKAIWTDIDVKDDDLHYHSIEEAWAAFTEFRNVVGLPIPSAVVKSGGGLHIYWISDQVLSPAEWAPYAHGLKALLIQHEIKCDAGLTTDDVRLLRLPGTRNYKYDPPRPVELLPIPLSEYDFSEQLAFLRVVAPAPAQTSVLLPAAFIGKKPILIGTDKLSDGIEKREMPPLPFEPIIKGCAFIREALETGGKDYSQPMWNLTTLCATFMEDGHGLAHRMGRGHPGYDAGDADELWARKLRERADRGLGWPSCQAVQASGCGACAGCPHFAAGKSPLTLATATSVARVSGPPTTDLPKGYFRNDDGFIFKLEVKVGKDGEESEIPRRLFLCSMDSFWPEKNESFDAIHFRASYDKDNFITGRVTLADMMGGQLALALANAKVKADPDNKRFLEGFFVSLLAKFHAAQQAVETHPFGWLHGDDAKPKGFIYAGRIFLEDGSDTPSGSGDSKLSKWYTVQGQLTPWMAACNLITGIGRPELDTMIALAFGSPLMELTGQEGVTINAYGESGAGKSAAMKVGLAVWGDPVLAKDGATSTKKSMLGKMGKLRNLPIYWDEITTPEVQKQAVDTSFLQTGGVEGSRMKANLEQQDRGQWCCIMGMSANVSLVDVVVKTQPSHRGGINRVLEYFVSANDPAKLINQVEADRIMAGVRRNYGHMGQMYAKYIGINHARITEDLAALRREIVTTTEATQEERFWTAGAAAILLGAKYANELGCSLGLDAMKVFLCDLIRKNRGRAVRENMVGGSAESTEELLYAYLKSRAAFQTIWVDGIASRTGRKAVTMLHGPVANINVRDGIMVAWDVADRKLRVSRRDFYAWLTQNERSTTMMLRGLVEHFDVKENRVVLAAGTSYKQGPEWTLCFDVKPGSEMDDIMLMYKDMTAVAEVAA